MATGEKPPKPPEIRRIDPREAPREIIEADGSASAAARRLGCSPSYVIDVRHGRRPASARMLGALGLQRIVVETGRG